MKRLKDILIGILIGCMMFATPVLAESVLTKIDVALNGVNVQVEGVDVDVNSILYNGTTYLPMRKVAELVGKDVEWKQETMTANIVEKKDGDILSINNTVVNDAIIYTENGIIVNGKEYYENSYVFKIIRDYGDEYLWMGYGFDENIKITLSKTLGNGNEEVLIDYVPYFLHEDRIYISMDYVGETVLPLLEKDI